MWGAYAPFLLCFLKFADFQVCHNPSMADLQELIKLRNELINTPLGDCLFKFLHDFVTEESCKNIDAMEVKGMCRLIQELKSIPSKLEVKKKGK